MIALLICSCSPQTFHPPTESTSKTEFSVEKIGKLLQENKASYKQSDKASDMLWIETVIDNGIKSKTINSANEKQWLRTFYANYLFGKQNSLDSEKVRDDLIDYNSKNPYPADDVKLNTNDKNNISNQSGNIVGKISWRRPYIHTPYAKYFNYSNFVGKNDGFEIILAKTDEILYWGIQVISDSFVSLDNKEYVLQFEVSSSQNGYMYFNIQTDNGSNMKQIFPGDERIEVYSDRPTMYTTTFTGDKQRGRLLTFKFGGELPSGTKLRVTNVAIVPK